MFYTQKIHIDFHSDCICYCSPDFGANIKMMKVAVIGGGAAGLCAARYLCAKPKLYQATVYEQSEQIGGTWVYRDDVGKDKYGQPIHSSMYSRLRTNLPKEVMLFPDLPIAEGGKTSFIKHTEVLQYLNRYVDTFHLQKCIQLLTRVESVKPVTKCGKTAWEVTVQSVVNPDSPPTVNQFDAVMVCNGQYAVPNWPSIPGLETFTGKVMHSHDYRHPEHFRGQSVVLLGAGNSGIDISLDLHAYAERVYLSHLHPLLQASLPANLQQVPGIKSVREGRVEFTDGRSVAADALILCTGYLYDFPFLTPECEVSVDRKRVTPLYKHVIHTKFPSLSFIGLVWRICPFLLMSCQVRFVMAALEGTMILPSKEEMDADTQRDYDYRCKELNMPHHYAHKLGDMQWEYCKELVRLANDVDAEDATKPIFEELYLDCSYWRSQDPLNYKTRTYELPGI
ncbi:flavin-containing monooxygenase FMO GS-OX-like 4 [Patiria miniata]|uniref:Flavin-containing monooxygenase n=1 Tax=Patiria miniata TaxID=46514 RepID=A0A914AMM5_PATMI|nr:flavin-containing monooxygenase FMO GS-OX-like 4 [Patiria miniata]